MNKKNVLILTLLVLPAIAISLFLAVLATEPGSPAQLLITGLSAPIGVIIGVAAVWVWPPFGR